MTTLAERLIYTFGIGVDESNHGQVPEIYVATLSKTPAHFRTSEIRFKKHRKNLKLENFLADIPDFRFVVLRENHLNRFGCHAIKTPATGLVINALSSNDVDIKKTKVLIDGKPGYKEAHNDLVRILSNNWGAPIYKKQVQFVVEGDRKYFVVNAADIIAYQLSLIYSQLKTGQRGPYDDNRVHFESTFFDL